MPSAAVPNMTAKQSEGLWNNYFPIVMWYKIMGLEETLEIKTKDRYPRDCKYLEQFDILEIYKKSYAKYSKSK